MSGKIMGTNYDDLAKLMGADLIVAGTAVIAEVRTGETFYAGSTTLLIGNLPTVAIVAASDAYPAGYHVGNVGGLDAIDVDLAPGNIKSGVTIFGKVGTASIIHDDEDVRSYSPSGSIAAEYETKAIPQTAITVIESFVLTCVQSTVIYAITCGAFALAAGGAGRLALYIDGVEIASGPISAVIAAPLDREFEFGHRAVASGARTVEMKIDNGGAATTMYSVHFLFAGCGKIG